MQVDLAEVATHDYEKLFVGSGRPVTRVQNCNKTIL